jgi:hypothetical protein
VTQIDPYAWFPNQVEPSAKYYFYLLFTQASDQAKATEALRAVICTLQRPLTSIPHNYPEQHVPLFIPVKRGAPTRLSNTSTEKQLVRFRSNSYDTDRAAQILGHLGADPDGVYLVAATRPLNSFANGSATHTTGGLRILSLSGVSPYERVTFRAIVGEAYRDRLFSRWNIGFDNGYIYFSLVSRIGSSILDIKITESANAAPPQDSAPACP